jgi:hypothetical protein
MAESQAGRELNMSMEAAIPIPMEAIRDFCIRWNIDEFALFGSAIRSDFHPESDIDILLTYKPGTRLTLDALLTMGDELEAIFGRSVDVIDRETLERSLNHLRREAILSSAQVLYAR